MRISFLEIFYYSGTVALQLKSFFLSRPIYIPLNLPFLSILLFTNQKSIETIFRLSLLNNIAGFERKLDFRYCSFPIEGFCFNNLTLELNCIREIYFI